MKLDFGADSRLGRLTVEAVVLSLLLCGVTAFAEEERGRVKATMVSKAPNIEGTLSDPAWKDAPQMTLRMMGDEGTELATTARVLFDSKFMYVAVECEEPSPDLVMSVLKRDGSVWTDDSIELYILPHPNVGYKQIVINPRGVFFDTSFAPGRDSNPGWNGDVRVAVSIEPRKRWKVALSVPLKDLGVQPGDNQSWRFNVTRNRPERRNYPRQEYSWAALPGSNYHQPHSFGIIEGINFSMTKGSRSPAAGAVPDLLRWVKQTDLSGVRKVFPHPLDPDLAWCVTSEGFFVTRDDGRTWRRLESVDSARVGEITCLAVSPGFPEVVCLGTDASGLFLSVDQGKSWKALGSEKEKPASAHIEYVDFCTWDPSWQTLMVTHGTAAPGLSISRDLGQTWEVLAADRYLKNFVKQGETIIASGSMPGEGEVWGIHRSDTDGLRWEESIRNIRPSEPAVTYSSCHFFFATMDGDILRSFDDGKTWNPAVRSQSSSWQSLFFTCKASTGGEILAAYDPHKEGLSLSPYRFSSGSGEKQNMGLYVGPFVKSGANASVNANGSTYYVVMNNTLLAGRWGRPAKGPSIVQAKSLPLAVRTDRDAVVQAEASLRRHIEALASGNVGTNHIQSIASASAAIEQREATMNFAVQARVAHPEGLSAIRSVTVDATGLGGTRDVPLYDDGLHNDGSAGDGLYAGTVRFFTRIFQQASALSRAVRGKITLPVTATDRAGNSDSLAAAVAVLRSPETIVLFAQGAHEGAKVEGPVTAQQVANEGAEAGAIAIRVAATGSGPWRGGWMASGGGRNIAGCAKLVFHIRGDRSQEVYVQLIDHQVLGPDAILDEPHFSERVPLIAGGYLKSITPAYQKASIPINKLLPKGVYFLRLHEVGVALSTMYLGKPGTYYISGAQIEP